MGLADFIKDFGSIFSTPTDPKQKIKNKKDVPTSVELFRPTENSPYSMFSTDAAKIPNVPLGYKFCVTSDTEILTEGGWKHFEDLDRTEKVASIKTNGELEYMKPIDYQKYWHDGIVYEVHTDYVDFAVTGDHRIYCSDGKSEFTFKKADQIEGKVTKFKLDAINTASYVKEFVIPETTIDYSHTSRSGNYVVQIQKVASKVVDMDDWVEFLGYYLSEGSLSSDGKGVVISQSNVNSVKKNKILECLERLEFNYCVTDHGFKIYGVGLRNLLRSYNFGYSQTKYIPREFLNLSQSQSNILLSALMLGDGDKRGNYWTSSKRLADDVQELSLKCGISASINERYMNIEKKPVLMYRVAIRGWNGKNGGHFTTINESKKNDKWVNYKGYVYDVTLPKNNTLYIRRKGKPIWTGNCFDLYNYNDVVRTVIRSLVSETFRNGISVVPRFALKCAICKYEYDTEVDKCTQCGSDNFRKPDQDEKRDLEEFIKDTNLNDETLKDVLTAIGVDVNVIDNAYLVVRKEYGFGKDRKVLTAKIKEVVRGAPISLKLIMNTQGRYARTDDNKLCLFCLDHRDVKYEIMQEDAEEDNEKNYCPKCNLHMYPCYYVYDQGGYLVTPLRSAVQRIYYTNGEILHFKKFSNGTGYGFPPLLSVWTKCMILMKMDWFVLQAYNLQRPPRGMLVMKATRESIQKSWDKMQEVAKVNPYMIYPLVVEPDNKDAKTVAEWVDFSFKSDDIEFIEYRNEIRRSIGALYGVSPLFQADTSTGVGLANEGLQLTVTNRAVEAEQDMFNSKVLEWLVKQVGITDWKIVLNPNEEKDQTAKLQRESMRADLAIKLNTSLGLVPKFKKGTDGIEFDYDNTPDVEKIINELRAYASKNKVQINLEEIKMMLLGQANPMGAAMPQQGAGGSQQGIGGGSGGGGALVGVTDGKGGIIEQKDGRNLSNSFVPHNRDGNNQKNPLSDTMTPKERKPGAQGTPFGGRPRKDPAKQRFSGEPEGMRKSYKGRRKKVG